MPGFVGGREGQGAPAVPPARWEERDLPGHLNSRRAAQTAWELGGLLLQPQGRAGPWGPMDPFVEPHCARTGKYPVLVLGRGLTVRPGKPRMKSQFVPGLRLRFPLSSVGRERLGSRVCEAACGVESHSPGELPALPCTPKLLTGTPQVDFSTSKVKGQGQFVPGQEPRGTTWISCCSPDGGAPSSPIPLNQLKNCPE